MKKKTKKIMPKKKADAKAIARYVALMPEGLRGFVARELDMGNKVGDAGKGSPELPGVVWVRLKGPFLTMVYALPKLVVHTRRPAAGGPAECADAERKFLVISGENPEKSAEKEDAPLRVSNFPSAALRVRIKKIRERAEVPSRRTEVLERSGVEDPISKAISTHLGLMWSKEIEEAIAQDVGKEGLARVREIDEFANRAELWQYGSHDQAYAQIQRELAEKYPFLSQDAIQRLSTRAAWSWR